MYNENITLFRGILVVRAIVKIMIDIYMFKQFLTLFFYLVERKVDMIEESNEEVPFKLRFLVVWVIILTILKIFISLNAIFTYGIYHAYADPSQVPEVIQFLYYFALRTVYWITDLLVVTSLIYFYYDQAKSLNIPRN